MTAIRIESKHRAESRTKQELNLELAFIVSFVMSHDFSLELVVVKQSPSFLFLLIHVSHRISGNVGALSRPER